MPARADRSQDARHRRKAGGSGRPEPSARSVAVAMLARRDHTRAEIEARLARRGFDVTAITAALDDLERRSLLSDARYASAVVERQAGRTGRRAIEGMLRRKGIAAPARAEALAGLAGRDEFDDARRVWSKRFGRAPADDRERARQFRFLLARGYAAETVAKVLRAAGTAAAIGNDAGGDGDGSQ